MFRFFGAKPTSRIKLPAHTVWLNWVFANECELLEFDITFHNDPGESVGSYFAPFNGYIGPLLAYGGFQTDVQHPDGHSMGKGVIFSTWSTFDANDAVVAEPDGFLQLGTHEGKFLGVRRPFAWTAGQLRFSLQKTVRNGEMDWFECTVSRLAGSPSSGSRPNVIGEPTFIGALRITRGGAMQRFTKTQLSFLEVYANAETFEDVAEWHMDVMAYGDGSPAIGLSIEYPDFPNNQKMPNCDAWFDTATGRANMVFGGQTVQNHPAGKVF